jgi:hypothetical protein
VTADDPAAAAAAVVTPRRSIPHGRLVWMLGITQIVGYGTVYYAFAILAADIAADFDWPVFGVYGLFSLALLVGGLAAPVVGARIDRHGAAAVMALGSLLVAAALALASLANGPMPFAAALIAIELAANLILYDAAFTALVQATGHGARRRITHLTLIAGFASTIFWPLTTWLHGILSWEAVMLVYLPLHLLLAARSRPAAIDPDAIPPPVVLGDALLPASVQRPAFVLATGGFAASNVLLSAIATQMVPMLGSLGLGAMALVVSGLFGPAQVLIRFLNLAAGHHRHPIIATIVAATLLPAAALLLALSAPLAAGAIAFAILLGFGSGLKSVVQGTLPLALFGGRRYGARLGRMALVRQVTGALSPFAFAWLMDAVGTEAALAILAGVAGLGLLAFIAIAGIRRRVARTAALPT